LSLPPRVVFEKSLRTIGTLVLSQNHLEPSGKIGKNNQSSLDTPSKTCIAAKPVKKKSAKRKGSLSKHHVSNDSVGVCRSVKHRSSQLGIYVISYYIMARKTISPKLKVQARELPCTYWHISASRDWLHIICIWYTLPTTKHASNV